MTPPWPRLAARGRPSQGVARALRSAASAAVRITSRGASRPVHSSSWRAPWWTSIPRPSTVRHPCAAAAASSGVRQRVVHEVGHDLARPAGSRGSTGSVPSSPMPSGVACTTQVGAADVVGLPARPRSPARAAAASPAAGRAVHDDDLPAAGLGQRPDDGPGRPARAEHHRGHPGRVDPVVEPQRVERGPPRRCSHRAAVRRGARRRCWPRPAPRPWRCARRPGAATSALWGIVTDSPARPRARTASSAPPAPPAGHLEGDVAPVQTARREGGVVHRGREAVARRATR